MSVILRPQDLAPALSPWVHQCSAFFGQWKWISYPFVVLSDIVAMAANYFVVYPLASLYLQGPLLLGFWGGADAPTICSRLLPHTLANFWASSPASLEECQRIIQQNFWAWLILARTIVYFILLCMGLLTVFRALKRRRKMSQRPHQ